MLKAVLAAWSDQLGKEWFEAYADNDDQAVAAYETNVALNGYRR